LSYYRAIESSKTTYKKIDYTSQIINKVLKWIGF